MTVSELIHHLHNLPADAEVWVAYQLKGVEDRYDEDLDDFITEDVRVEPLEVDDGTAVWIKAVDDLPHEYVVIA